MSYQQFDEPAPQDNPDEDNIATITNIKSMGKGISTFSPTPKTRELRIERHGITWIMDLVPHGTFVNGDPWVVGPVIIKEIQPGTAQKDERRVNGSMVNPHAGFGMIHGYDEAMFGPYKGRNARYNPELDFSLKVKRSRARGVMLQPNQSLVSVESHAEAGVRPQLLHAAVLTCLEERAPADSFRPGYSDGEKTIEYNESDIDYTVLGAQGGLIDGTSGGAELPGLAPAVRRLEGLWLDHMPEWIVRYSHPSANMPDYSRELCLQFGHASLLTNVTNHTEALRKPLVRHLIQKGIDLWSVIQGPGGINQTLNSEGIPIKETPFVAGDGQSNGYMWRILYAGLMLGDVGMLGIGSKSAATGLPSDFDYLFQGENGQCFTVAETPDGKINWGHGGYAVGDIGLDEWGPKHSTRPEKDGKALTASAYRTCCSASSWWGQALAMLIMNGSSEWNHAPYIDYLDRYAALVISESWTGLIKHGGAQGVWNKLIWIEHRGVLT